MKILMAIVSILLLCGLLVAGCSDDAVSPVEETNMTAAGGTLSFASGAVSLVFPPGAVSEDVLITATAVMSSDGQVVPGAAYEFGPDGAQFNAPLSLTISYDPEAVPVGTPENILRLHSEAGGVWKRIHGSRVDETAGTVTGEVMSFSTYGARGTDVETISPPIAKFQQGGSSTMSRGVTEPPGRLTHRKQVLSVNKFDTNLGELLSAHLVITADLSSEIHTHLGCFVPGVQLCLIPRTIWYRIQVSAGLDPQGPLVGLLPNGEGPSLSLDTGVRTVNTIDNQLVYADVRTRMSSDQWSQDLMFTGDEIEPFLAAGSDTVLTMTAEGGQALAIRGAHETTGDILIDPVIGFALAVVPYGDLVGWVFDLVSSVEDIHLVSYSDSHAAAAFQATMEVTYVYAPN